MVWPWFPLKWHIVCELVERHLDGSRACSSSRVEYRAPSHTFTDLHVHSMDTEMFTYVSWLILHLPNYHVSPVGRFYGLCRFRALERPLRNFYASAAANTEIARTLLRSYLKLWRNAAGMTFEKAIYFLPTFYYLYMYTFHNPIQSHHSNPLLHTKSGLPFSRPPLHYLHALHAGRTCWPTPIGMCGPLSVVLSISCISLRALRVGDAGAWRTAHRRAVR